MSSGAGLSLNLAFGLGGALSNILFVLLFGFIVYRVFKLFRDAKKSQESLTALVKRRGLGYLEEDPTRVGYFTGFPFDVGLQRRARNIVWGAVAGRSFETFAYTFDQKVVVANAEYYANMRERYGLELNSPEGSENPFQITWVPLPGVLPTVRFVPSHAGWPSSAAHRDGAIEVESVEFNGRWTVTCADPRIGHAVLTPRMIERFLEPDLRDVIVSIEGLAVWTARRGVGDLYDLDYMVQQAYSIADLIPRFLFEQPDGAPGGA